MTAELTFLPDADTTLLLQAALWEGLPALRAWNEWRARVDLNHLDLGAYRLLPLLWRNLSTQGVDNLPPLFKAVYRQAWLKNRLVFHTAARVLGELRAAGIPTLTLKGPALTLLYYGDHGARPMDDFDLLVQPPHAVLAMRLLTDGGWTPILKKMRDPAILIPLRHGIEFADDKKNNLDLHWRLLPESPANDDGDFWDGSVALTVEGVESRALNSSDQLLHVCAHGARWNPIPPVRWAADAYLVLTARDKPLDWDRLLAQTERRRLILPLRDTLTYLARSLAAPVPERVLDCLNRARVSAREQREYDARVQPQGFWGYIPATYYDYARRVEKGPLPLHLIGFARYLQYTWDVEHLWQLPYYMLRKSWGRLRRV